MEKQEKRKFHPINKEKYVLAYKWCQEEINNKFLVPDIKESDMDISKENWLMFRIAGEIHKDDAIKANRPNVFLNIYPDKFGMGITMNQVGAVDKFLNIIGRHATPLKQKIVSQLQSLPKEFKTKIKRKIKDKHFHQAPTYRLEKEFPSNQINEEKFTLIIQNCENIRAEGIENKKMKLPNFNQQTAGINFNPSMASPNFYQETPEILLAYIESDYSEENIKFAAKHLFPLLALTLNVDTKENTILHQIMQEKNWQSKIEEVNDKELSELILKPLYEKFKNSVDHETFKKICKRAKQSQEFKQWKIQK